MGQEKVLTMDEIQRVRVVTRYESGVINAEEAAELIGRSERQFYRILGKYRKDGIESLAHGNRGKTSPRKIPAETEARAIELHRTKYGEDILPDVINDIQFTQKLNRVEGIQVGYETVRVWLRRAKIPPKHPNKQPKHRSRRERKSQPGMMLQVDGSHHAWFPFSEDRYTLIMAIDDADSQIVYAYFDNAETTMGYMRMGRSIVTEYGVPLAIYADRHSSFKTTRKATVDEQLKGIRHPDTQVVRALKELGIRYIPAGSPQAKGRVERNFGTLQDRLVIELILAKVKTIEEANELLLSYIPEFNQEFNKKPADDETAWRPIPEDIDLDNIFCKKDTRVVANDNTVSYDGRTLQIPPNAKRYSYVKAKVDVYELINGSIRVFYKGEQISDFPVASVHENIKVTAEGYEKREHQIQSSSYCRA